MKHPKYNKGYYKNKEQRRKKKLAARRAAFAANPEMQGDPNLSTDEENTEWMNFWDENGNPIEEKVAADKEMEQEREVEVEVKKSKKQRKKETHLARRAANKAARGGESQKERAKI